MPINPTEEVRTNSRDGQKGRGEFEKKKNGQAEADRDKY
jgi:hypothetical protein